jgi:hypothetical protein
MKPESLHALLLDRELGELSAEAAELLDAWLAEHPQSASAAPALRRTVATTRAAVRRFPELARPEPEIAPSRLARRFHIAPGRSAAASNGRRFNWAPVALAASLMLALGAGAWLGFRAGEGSAERVARQGRPAPAMHPHAAGPSGPWARYALASDPRGGLTLVRRTP